MARRWHPNKDIERILKLAERCGWRVESPAGVQMNYSVTLQGALSRADLPLPAAEVEGFLDALADQLRIAGAQDVAIGASGSTAMIEVSVTVEAADVDEALTAGVALIRGAATDAARPAPTIAWSAGSATKLERLGA